MAIDRKYNQGFIRQLDASQNGDVTYIPLALERMNDVFNLMPSRYTLISGATGSGKTSFGDFTYVLAPWCFIKDHEDIHWEVNYFSLERKSLFKHAKWVSWMIYRDNTSMLLSADQILGWKNGPINSTGYQLVRSYDDEMSELLSHINMYDSKVSSKVIKRTINRRAKALGVLYQTDAEGCKIDNSLLYSKKFDDENLIEENKFGKVRYLIMEHQGEKFKLYEDDHRYFMHKPKSFVFFVIDGINLLGNKDTIDDVSMMLANARDLYGFSPIVITQQNRAMGDTTRMKMHGADLSPQIEDIFKSSQMGFDADLIIGLFDPSRYKSWDKQGKYGGYAIIPMDASQTDLSMQTQTGFNRFRSAHILKNTFGPDGGKFGMKFLGECNHFEVLPKADDVLMLEQIYSDIRKGI
jgi:hypothetical protein